MLKLSVSARLKVSDSRIVDRAVRYRTVTPKYASSWVVRFHHNAPNYCFVAQLVECLTVNQVVAGSTPAKTAIYAMIVQLVEHWPSKPGISVQIAFVAPNKMQSRPQPSQGQRPFAFASGSLKSKHVAA